MSAAILQTPLPDAVCARWCWTAPASRRSLVLPDGCRDLIRVCPSGARPRAFVSALYDTAGEVACACGDRFVGYRLHPAAVFDEEALLASTRACVDRDEPSVLVRVADLVRLDADLDEALLALAESRGVAEARRALGVSERSFERSLTAATGRPPAWWRSLARVRRAAAALVGDDPLVVIAADAGYSDQAHMNRDFRRWFGLSPGRLRAMPELLSVAVASGYGVGAIGVQSSTKKPSRSVT
jgi:AraC-like DNA-binding protein